MTPREDLHALIQALNNREKQLVTMSANGKQPAYLCLFQELARIEHYDEKAFLISSEGRPFAKHYSVKKNELYEKILTTCRSQRQFGGADKPIEFQVREGLEDVRMLKEKRLFAQAFRRLSKAKKLARRFELHEILIEALRAERFMVVDRQAPGYIEIVQELHIEIEKCTMAISNKFRLLELKDRLFLVARQFAEQSGQYDVDYLKSVLAEKDLANIESCLSFNARVNFYLCHSIFHHLTGNVKTCWEYFRKIYRLWEAHPHFRRVDIVEHRNILQNYLMFSNAANEYGDFDAVLASLEAGPFRSTEEKAVTIFNVINVRLSRYLSDCDWEKVAEVRCYFLEVEKSSAKHLSPNRAIVFALHFAWVSFVLQDYEAAIKWLNRIEITREENLGQGLIFRSKMLEVLVLFEAGEVKLLESRSRTIVTALSKKQENFAFELRLVKMLNRYVGTHQDSKFDEQLKELHTNLVENDLIDAVQHGMTRVWLKARIEAISMKAVVERDRAEEDIES